MPGHHPRPREEARRRPQRRTQGPPHGLEHREAATRPPTADPHPIFEGIPDEAYFYFVHSYAPYPDDPTVVIGQTTYGDPDAGGTFASVLAKDNIVATQFHPEKSAEHGLRLYANFLKGASQHVS